MNASRNRPGWLASLGNVNSRPRYPGRYTLGREFADGKEKINVKKEKERSEKMWALRINEKTDKNGLLRSVDLRRR